MSSEPLTEDEFKDRDALGLKKVEGTPVTEEMETKKYMKLLLCVLPMAGLVLATCLYLLCAKLLGYEAMLEKKFAFISEYDLGYVFLVVWMLAITRAVNICRANGARAPALVDRPDQHVYKIMASSGPLKDAPYVMMASTGPQGRFNRAQRGVFNGDESMPVVLMNAVLSAIVFGPLVPVLCLLIVYGRITFAKKYKELATSRSAGFIPSMIGEQLMQGLVLFTAIKSIFYERIPF
mmetsp:Transcript_56087/g.88902  ORF Transcript_56087/g.88902 Transcript_56087/m.88902 type:complete len:236 (-) Transcript_56087:99-806(-)|eukprot:CAMPEP_0169124452 /NCGR_PEP_ID=MMETSP1015-20121227/34331_1 /TAXON_ID=342587 /ORGANISM="Karlodinium micrum, Strain CCMP2283" /LENGTH=235 /DNA_ID=CAMNT_0009187867 /DNA_START=86 /DNA_END=793 /DNA_ORIENTATION=+